MSVIFIIIAVVISIVAFLLGIYQRKKSSEIKPGDVVSFNGFDANVKDIRNGMAVIEMNVPVVLLSKKNKLFSDIEYN